jgi:hypothetical protein
MMADNGAVKADDGNRRLSHRHFCDIGGHDYQCSDDCSCICGLPMNGFDHSGCPVELKACPEHKAEEERRMAQVCSPEAEAESKRLRGNGRLRPTASAGVPATLPARSSGGASIAITCTASTVPKFKSGISLSIVPERPRR